MNTVDQFSKKVQAKIDKCGGNFKNDLDLQNMIILVMLILGMI